MADQVRPFGKKVYDLAYIDPDICTGCGYCTMFCIMSCIHLQPDGLYRIDTDQCIGCQRCRVNCFNEAVRLISLK